MAITDREDRERDLLAAAQWLDLDQDTCAGLWMQVFVGGDPHDETADELWKKAWAFARSAVRGDEEVTSNGAG